MTSRITLAFALLFAFASLPVGAAIQLRLRVEPPSQLPGMEPTLRVEAINTGSTPAELPLRVALQATPPGEGKPFVAYTGLRGDDRVTSFWTDDDAAASIMLAPRETRDVSFWAGPESPVWFAADSRLFSPGPYRFQLVAHRGLDSELLGRVERAVDQGGLVEPVVSNEVTYTVQMPTGDDAAVWELIRKLQSPTMWRDSLGARIWADYPGSRYTAQCLNKPPSGEASLMIAAYDAALEKGTSPSWAEWYRLNIADYELSRARSFVTARNVESAIAASSRAETILRQLVAQSPNPLLRREAQDMLFRQVRTREGIIRDIQIAKGELIETQPHVGCVEKTADGKHVFWFGYENVSRKPMTIPIGPDNQFTPPPFDRGQPTVFPAGITWLGLRVPTDEPVLNWHLRKYNIQASLQKTPPCPADFLERYTYEPPQRE